jgi:excisionase family DNA binding protein
VSDRLLTTREVADRLAVSPETILRWHRSGKLPGGRRLGSNVLRFSEVEIDRWLDTCAAHASLKRESLTRELLPE